VNGTFQRPTLAAPSLHGGAGFVVSPPCHPGAMNDQLDLLPPARRSETAAPRADDDTSWELDDHTRHVGRLGLAAARQALRQASSRLAA
jgi:hypothetical protein